MNRKTQAQRDAIDARAAAWPRPLSQTQRQALMRMAFVRLVRTRAGWGSETGVVFWPSPTIRALEKRGLCRIHARRFAIITAKGRRELKRHRGTA